MAIQATLCFILHENRVLLLKKNPGLFGAGKWNAAGGKVQPNETAEHCAIREVYEETGLEVRKPRKIGTLVFFKHDEHRSEEHTSELQSRPHLVCRLLLEKKKKYYLKISMTMHT